MQFIMWFYLGWRRLGQYQQALEFQTTRTMCKCAFVSDRYSRCTSAHGAVTHRVVVRQSEETSSWKHDDKTLLGESTGPFGQPQFTFDHVFGAVPTLSLRTRALVPNLSSQHD